MMRILGPVLCVIFCFSWCAIPAQAGLVTYSGFDASPGGSVDPTAPPFLARQDFLRNVRSFGTEDFESFALNSGAPLDLTFEGNGLTGTLTAGSLFSISGAGGGTFPTSGSKQAQDGGADFRINFDAPISAFGFYATDVGDIQGNLALNLREADGSTSRINVPITNRSDGNLMFFGFTDDTKEYTSVEFDRGFGTSSDGFGYDDIIAGTAVPEPGHVALLTLAAISGAGYRLRRKWKRSAS